MNVSVKTPEKISMGDRGETLQGIEENHSLPSSSSLSLFQAVERQPGRAQRRVTQQPAEEKRVSKIPQKEKNGASNPKNGDSNAPRLMNNRVAGEDEVERFFEDYLRCYAQRDIDGFLVAFPPEPFKTGKKISMRSGGSTRSFQSQRKSALSSEKSKGRNLPL